MVRFCYILKVELKELLLKLINKRDGLVNKMRKMFGGEFGNSF